MKHFKDIEELIIDDSFINYCFQSDEQDCAYWENVIDENPEERAYIEEARRIVISLRTALSEKHESENKEETPLLFEKKRKFTRLFTYSSVAVASIIAIFVVRFYLKPATPVDDRNIVTESVVEEGIVYRTKKGERKLITLFDSTKIWLNADSELKIEKNYGKKYRSVYLVGEALFDVQHDEQIPFVVHTDKYQVRDLGTVFNVKAYPGDELSEASLIQGEIEVAISGMKEKITLKPNQKIVFNNESVTKGSSKIEKDLPEKLTELSKDVVAIAPLNYSSVDSALIETSWIDRLEFDNESLYQMKDKLERWFGVDIRIEDSGVGKYPFTATFKDENIEEALRALQYAYPFNFKIDNDEVIIKK